MEQRVHKLINMPDMQMSLYKLKLFKLLDTRTAYISHRTIKVF